MRKRFTINLSTEDSTDVSDIIEPDINEDTVINPVELQEYVDNKVTQQEISNDARNTFIETQRLSYVAAGLEDLAKVVGTMDEITPRHRALVYNALNMAVAGTDVDARLLAPGIESYTDGRLAAEGILDKVKAIKSSIGSAIKNAISKVTGMFSRKKQPSPEYVDFPVYLSKLNNASVAHVDVVTSNKGGFFLDKNNRHFTTGEEFVKAWMQALNELDHAVNKVMVLRDVEKIVQLFSSSRSQEDYAKVEAEIDKLYDKNRANIKKIFKRTENAYAKGAKGNNVAVLRQRPSIGDFYLQNIEHADTDFSDFVEFGRYDQHTPVTFPVMELGKLKKTINDIDTRLSKSDAIINEKRRELTALYNRLDVMEANIKGYPDKAKELLNYLLGFIIVYSDFYNQLTSMGEAIAMTASEYVKQQVKAYGGSDINYAGESFFREFNYISTEELSVEGIKEIAQKVWEFIKNVLKRAYEWVVEHLKMFMTSYQAITNRLDKINRAQRYCTVGEEEDKFISVPGLARNLSMSGRAPSSPSDINNRLKQYGLGINYLTGDMLQSLKFFKDVIRGDTYNIEQMQPKRWLDAANELSDHIDFDSVARSDDGKYKLDLEFPGNRAIQREVKKITILNKDITLANKVTVAPFKEKQAAPEDKEYPVLSPESIRDALGAVSGSINSLNDFHKSAQKLKENINLMTNFVKRMEKADHGDIRKAVRPDEEDLSTENLEFIKRLIPVVLNYSTSLVYTVSNISLPIYNAVCNYLEKSLLQYETNRDQIKTALSGA